MITCLRYSSLTRGSTLQLTGLEGSAVLDPVTTGEPTNFRVHDSVVLCCLAAHSVPKAFEVGGHVLAHRCVHVDMFTSHCRN